MATPPTGFPVPFAKYRLLRKLARGGMAELFLATEEGKKAPVVIKRVLPHFTQDTEFLKMFLNEARIAALLNHPSIVHVFDVGQVDGTYFIAMEHVHGEDLRSIVRQMRKKGVNEFPLEHALAIILAMCAGLSYAHERRDLDGTALNIVHRDISPQNVLLSSPTGLAKVCDFGVVRASRIAEDSMEGRVVGKLS
jgi:eukaryotic-like serine/threonine-protein kinase